MATELLMKHIATRPYNAGAPLVLSGGLNTKAAAKCYHALIALMQLHGLRGNSNAKNQYEYRVGIHELHILTQQTHKNWDEYLKTFEGIRDEVRLKWAELAKPNAKVNRIGTTPILSECYIEKDLINLPDQLVFAIPGAIVEDIIKPYQFGQLDKKVLFGLRSTYAFNAYLNACLLTIEKNVDQDKFYSRAFDLNEWRSLLGVKDDLYPEPSKFKAFVFKRASKSIQEATKDSANPIKISWKETATRSGRFQMLVQRQKKRTPNSKTQLMPDPEEEKAKCAAIIQRIMDHPKKAEIMRAIGYEEESEEVGNGTYTGIFFSLSMNAEKFPDGVTLEDLVSETKN